MLKTKSFEINPKEKFESSKQNFLDLIFGWNNAFSWWSLETEVSFSFSWEGQRSEGSARGDQVMDLLIGLVEKYKWEGANYLIKAEFSWDDDKK